MTYYGNAEGFKEYLMDRGMSTDNIETDVISVNSALLYASEWLDNRYNDSWIGYKNDRKQSRCWPRKNAVDQMYPYYYTYKRDEIPENVIKATYEGAYRYLQDGSYLLKDFSPNVYDSVSVSGAVSVVYNKGVSSSSYSQNEIPIIDTLMRYLIDPDYISENQLSGRVIR